MNGDKSAPTLATPADLAAYTNTLDCIHCGLCLRTCPTYQLTGSEAASPRGRIHLMRAAAENRLEPDAAFAEEMDFCLLCRHCESACPAGVHFGALMEHTRGTLPARVRRPAPARFLRWLGFAKLLPNRRALGLVATATRLAQRTGAFALGRRVLGRRGRFMDGAPDVPARAERRPLPATTPAVGPRRGTVLLLEGCVMPIWFGATNRSAAHVLSRLGFDVVAPAAVTCCGSLHAHNGEPDLARALAKSLLDAYEQHPDAAIVLHSAGCGAHVAELSNLFEPDDPLHARAEAVEARVVDLTEFTARHLTTLELRATGLRNPVAWDAPCHLCHAQGVRDEPKLLLDAVPGLERVELEDEEACCGSAGIYALLRPDDAAGVLAPKLEALARSGARTLVTANPGCQLHIAQGARRAGLDLEVLHIADVLERALRSDPTNAP